MNLWRIAVDQASGRAHGAPEPVTTGVQASAGAAAVLEGRLASGVPIARRLDQSGRAFRSTRRRCAPASPVAARHAEQHPHPERRVAGRQADRVLQHRRTPGGPVHRPAGRADAPRHRRSAARSRAGVHARRPVARVLFESRRQLGAVDHRRRRRRLRKIADAPAGAVYVVRLAERRPRSCSQRTTGRAMFSAPLASTPAPATQLPGTAIDGKYFNPTGWSPDGTRLAGHS